MMTMFDNIRRPMKKALNDASKYSVGFTNSTSYPAWSSGHFIDAEAAAKGDHGGAR
jgi:hypothetical protein